MNETDIEKACEIIFAALQGKSGLLQELDPQAIFMALLDIAAKLAVGCDCPIEVATELLRQSYEANAPHVPRAHLR